METLQIYTLPNLETGVDGFHAAVANRPLLNLLINPDFVAKGKVELLTHDRDDFTRKSMCFELAREYLKGEINTIEKRNVGYVKGMVDTAMTALAEAKDSYDKAKEPPRVFHVSSGLLALIGMGVVAIGECAGLGAILAGGAFEAANIKIFIPSRKKYERQIPRLERQLKHLQLVYEREKRWLSEIAGYAANVLPQLNFEMTYVHRVGDVMERINTLAKDGFGFDQAKLNEAIIRQYNIASQGDVLFTCMDSRRRDDEFVDGLRGLVKAVPSS